MPEKINIPSRVLLIPFFPNPNIISTKKLQKKFSILGSQIYVYPSYALITGFIGYTHLLTLLEFIDAVKEKEIFFLGTAGAVHDKLSSPVCLNVIKICGSSVLRLFHTGTYLSLRPLIGSPYSPASGVSVDIPLRENFRWLNQQRKRNVDVVDMELFPLRAYIKKPFYSLVVVTDRIERDGIHAFPEKEKVKKLFSQAFLFLLRFIHEK